MERRKFLIGAGSAAIGSSALIGSGAVSSITADRDVNLAIAGDSNGYLGLQAGNNGYVEEENGLITFNFDENAAAAGDGINNRADTTLEDAFTVANQSDRELEVWVSFAGTGGDTTGTDANWKSGGARSVELLAEDSGGDDRDLTYPNSEFLDDGEEKSAQAETSRTLGQTENTGAVTIPAGDSRDIEIRFLVYGSGNPRDEDFRFVFQADEDGPDGTDDWVVEVHDQPGA